MPNAAWVVEAEVKEVLSTGPTPPPPPNAKPGATSVGWKAASQTVKLTITNVLKGEKAAELIVEKPVGSYSLKPGNKGPFLIDASKTILGRYGPDSWNLDRVKGAMK
ncbi:MAG: hypothetical protein JNJ54_25465 [Myxococcaceae bacterium]|nr:hypothetical protein [Myxococcaceae bacterium]